MVVGCFEVELLDAKLGRWRAKNTLTGVVHVTYGTEPDVRKQLEKQTTIWEQKMSDKRLRIRGSAWRGQISAETRKAAGAKQQLKKEKSEADEDS